MCEITQSCIQTLRIPKAGAVSERQAITLTPWGLLYLYESRESKILLHGGEVAASAWENLNSWETAHREDAMPVLANGTYYGVP